MHLMPRLGAATLLLGLLPWPSPAFPPGAPTQAEPPSAHNGQHDFDPLFGTWKYRLKRIQHPVMGSTSWLDLDGTGACYRVWDGRGQLDTLDVDGPSGHIQG